MKTKAIACLLLVALAACGNSPGDGVSSTLPGVGTSGSSGPDAPVSMTPAPGGDMGGGRPQRVRPRPGMADVRPVGWDRARQTPSGRALRITYWSGVEPCNVLDRVEVSYEQKQIVVTLFEGHDPDADDVACIEIAVKKVVVVALEQPVDGRRVADGAAF